MMSFRKISWVLICFLLLTACTTISKKEAIKRVQEDLQRKYQSEFIISEIEISCAKLLAECYKGMAMDKQNPHIPFRITYWIKDDTTSDEYLEEYWKHQAAQDLEKPLKQSFQLTSIDRVTFLLDVSNDLPINLTPKTFPHYEKQLGKKIGKVHLHINKGYEEKRVDSHPEKDEEERKKEAEGIIRFKNQLIHQGMTTSELKYYNVHVATKSHRRSYQFTMDHVVDDPKEMEKRMIELETRVKPYDTYTTETMLPIRMQDSLKEKYQSEFTITNLRKECIANNQICEWVAIAKDNRYSTPPFTVKQVKGKIQDEYLETFWSQQIKEDWRDDIKASFQLTEKDQIHIVVDRQKAYERMTPQEFPRYRKEIGNRVGRVDFQLIKGNDKDQKIDEERRQVAEGLVRFKKQLQTKGIRSSELNYFYIEIQAKSGRRYLFNMDLVLDDPNQMEEQIQNIERERSS